MTITSLPILAASLVFAPGPGPDDSPPEAILKERGLTRSGLVYILAAEAPVLAKMNEVRALFATWSGSAERLGTIEAEAARAITLGEQKIQGEYSLTQMSSMISVALPKGATAEQKAERDQVALQVAQLRAGLTNLSLELDLLRNRAVAPTDKLKLEAQVKDEAEAYLKALPELRAQVDLVRKAYADLAADDRVKAALDALKKAPKAGKLRLGPSDAFLAGLRQLEAAERQFNQSRDASSGSAVKARPKAKAKAKAKR